MSNDYSDAIIVWQNDPPPLETIAIIRGKMAKSEELSSLDAPQDLTFWSMPLIDGEYIGPCVVLTGNEKLPGFNAWYYPEGGGGVQVGADEFETMDMEDIVSLVKEKYKAK